MARPIPSSRSRYSGIETELTYFVPLGQLFEYWRLKVTNKSTRERKLSVFTYCEFASCWNMPNDLSNLQYSQFVIKAGMVDGILGMASHPYVKFDPTHLDECGRTWMALTGAPVAGYETVRENFFGDIYRTYANPRAVAEGKCSNFLAEGENGCGTFQADLALAPGESRELIVLLGIGTPESHGRNAVAQFGNPERCAAEFETLKAHWHELLDVVKVKTPDPDFDHMANVWGGYNSLITYAWSRHASMIYNGERDGLGFRDTVQDFLGVMPLMKGRIRQRLELMLTGQVASGGAIPVIKTFGHRPGREKAPQPEEFRSDDCQWFFNAVPDYVAETGDLDFYRKVLPYADEGEATVLGHLRRALEFNLERSGRNGLPCGLHADWNDCVKMGYNGESVMVAFQLRYGLDVYAKIADRLGLPAEAAWAREDWPSLKRTSRKPPGTASGSCGRSYIAPVRCVGSRDTSAKVPRLLASTIRAYNVRQHTRSANFLTQMTIDLAKLDILPDAGSKEGFANALASKAPGDPAHAGDRIHPSGRNCRFGRAPPLGCAQRRWQRVQGANYETSEIHPRPRVGRHYCLARSLPASGM